MKQIEKEIVQKQLVYEITKEELESLKREERNNGRGDVLGYIGFCWNYFEWKKNFYGITEFIKLLINFINGDISYINNIYEYNFSDYVKHYR